MFLCFSEFRHFASLYSSLILSADFTVKNEIISVNGVNLLFSEKSMNFNA